ncbi:MAG: glycosyltransferase family 2 protein [Opitutaceae bacterium]|nr:glycosyltransferase family 2 protein [Opitutaceae bacterium]MBP9911804.1 glycosyltransferase family 2 protein [Opitutaceae bacterium]
MFSVVILTLNEEVDLPGCLASVADCEDVVVLDSGSTDRTAEIAQAAGARVFVNPFVNFAQQRNHAHESISFRHSWVFHLDADETMTPALHAECLAFATSPQAAHWDGCYVAPCMMFRGCWIPHCTDYPAYQARFAHVQRFRFAQSGHGQREAAGLRLTWLKANYLHNLSAQTEEELAAKHAHYAKSEARTFVATQRPRRKLLPALVASDPLQRRRALKELSYHLPFRGLLRFFYQYVLRGGFLDGRPAFAYCLMLARYEQDIARAIRQLRSEPPAVT